VLADIIDLDRLVVAAQVPATELRLLKVGQAVTIDPAAPGEKPATEKAGDAGGGTVGAVTFLGFEVDPKTGTVLVRASLPKDAPLRPGQYVRVRVQVEEQVDCLAVPEQSLVEVADVGATIALLDGDDAKQVPVEVGIRERGLACVKGDGLKVGAAIVTAGAYGLPKETKVRVLPE
jgi:multidrug efflux pump subunit AcrA (membrane-fusion protein)